MKTTKLNTFYAQNMFYVTLRFVDTSKIAEYESSIHVMQY